MRRPITLIEISLVMALLALIAGIATWSLGDMLTHHRLQKGADEVCNLLSELQIEALTLGSDIDITISENQLRTHSPEKILQDRHIEFSGVQATPAQFQLLSTGRFDPAPLIILQKQGKKITIDLTEPLLIKRSPLCN